jgi:hypothetical protein
MRLVLQTLLALALVALSATPALAKRDPLNNAEVDELRDAAQEPVKRIQLFVKFIRVRMTSLDQLSNDPRVVAQRAAQTHDLLEDLDSLLLEMDDNIDMYAKQNSDLRKALKPVIDMDTELQTKLKAMKAGHTHTENPADSNNDMKSYRFALDNALESATSSLENARDLLQEQEVAFQKKKSK